MNKFDTSGAVLRTVIVEVCPMIGASEMRTETRVTHWPDLSPFVQGYVEAMFASANVAPEGCYMCHEVNGPQPVGFSDLAPETLARLMEDCERWLKLYSNTLPDAKAGANFWLYRTEQWVTRNDFPPLTVYLSDDGKIYFKD